MLVNCLHSYEKTENGWLLHADTADVLVVFLTDDMIRIRVNFDRKFDEASYTLVTTAWPDRLDPLFEGERKRIEALDISCAEDEKTLTFETESGYQGVFPTLSIETVPISLLAEDTVSGATAISFSAPENKGKEKLGVISMNGMFSLECAMPDGYKIESTGADAGSHFSVISSEVEGKPAMYLSIVFNELLADVQRLNDLSAEDLAKIEETFREDDRVEISYTETKHGTKLMVVKETDDGVDYVDFYTIYKGYEIEFVLLKTPFGEEPGFLNDTDIQMAVDFLSDLDFVAAE